MKIAGIIAEYNPFHNGHKYHIEKTREMGADIVVVCMSGNYVQRGEMAFFSKHDRAKMAIMGGADLVIELPLRFVLSSAENFAYGGIKILDRIGADFISFGSEDEISELEEIVEIIEDENFFNEMKPYLDSGVSFAKARSFVVAEKSPKLSEIINKPNNILGIEYIKNIRRLDSKMGAISVKRNKSQHDSDIATENMTSATNIRKYLEKDDTSSIEKFLPKEIYLYIKNIDNHISREREEIAILSRLRGPYQPDQIKFADMGEGIENRIQKAMENSTTLDELYNIAKTKRYPESRIRRAVMQISLGLNIQKINKEIQYGRILAFNDKGKEVLKINRKNENLRLFHSILRINRTFGDDIHLKQEILANNLYNLCMIKPEKCYNDINKS